MAKDDIDRKLARMERAIRKEPDRFTAPLDLDPVDAQRIVGRIVDLSANTNTLTIGYGTGTSYTLGSPSASSHTHQITANTSYGTWNSNVNNIRYTP